MERTVTAIVFLLFIIPQLTFALGFNDGKDSYTFDSAYVKSFSHKLNVTFPVSSKYMSFKLIDKSTKNLMQFKPNQNVGLGLMFNYKFLGLGFGINAGFLNNDNVKKGNTRYVDFSTNMYFKKFTIDLNIQNYKGFYINNHTKYTDYWKLQDLYPVREDISAASFGSTFYYVVNNQKLSYPGAFAYTHMQKRSTGSLLMGGFFSFFEVKGDSSFVYGSFKNNFSDKSYVNYAYTFQHGVSVGYIYTFVMKKRWYATISFNPGSSILQYYAYGTFWNDAESKTDTIEYYSKSSIAFKLQSRLAFGYNSDQWYGGMVIMGDSFSQDNISPTQIDYQFGNFRLFIGRRFSIGKNK